jgi:hypothetical protein
MSFSFWLLLAITLCADIGAVAWLFYDLENSASSTSFIALAYAQVSYLSIWAALRNSVSRLRWLAPFGAGFVVAATMLLAALSWQLGQSSRSWVGLILAYLTLMWLHVALLLLLFWLLKPTRLLSTNIFTADRARWQFTTKHLFILMTGLPILVIVYTNSLIISSGVSLPGALAFAAWVTGNAVLPLLVFAIVLRRWPWPLQLAASVALAGAIGLLLNWVLAGLTPIYPVVLLLIQALVIWLWLRVFSLQRSADRSTELQPAPANVECEPPPMD